MIGDQKLPIAGYDCIFYKCHWQDFQSIVEKSLLKRRNVGAGIVGVLSADRLGLMAAPTFRRNGNFSTIDWKSCTAISVHTDTNHVRSM